MLAVFVLLFKWYITEINGIYNQTTEAIQALIARYVNEPFIRDIISSVPEILNVFQKIALLTQELSLLDIYNNVRNKEKITENVNKMIELSILSNDVDRIFGEYSKIHPEMEIRITEYLTESKLYHIRGSMAKFKSFNAMDDFLYNL